MHPLISAYLKWMPLYKLVVFHDRKDLEDAKAAAWELYRTLRDGDKP